MEFLLNLEKSLNLFLLLILSDVIRALTNSGSSHRHEAENQEAVDSKFVSRGLSTWRMVDLFHGHQGIFRLY